MIHGLSTKDQFRKINEIQRYDMADVITNTDISTDAAIRDTSIRDNLDISVINTLPPIITSNEYTKEDFHCLRTKRCILPANTSNADIIDPLSVIVGSDSVKLSFDKFGEKTLQLENIDIDSIEYEDTDGDYKSLKTLYNDQSTIRIQGKNFEAGSTHLTSNIIGSNKISEIQTKVADLDRPTRFIYKFPIKLPCWIRYIRIQIWGRWYRFPVTSWSRRCCGRTSGFGSFYSNATGCHSGTGPFLSEAQCENMCEPFYPPAGQGCVFKNVTYAHGQEVSGCAGTTCSCDDGVFTCDDCRWRREIHDVHGNTANPSITTTEEQQVVDSLLWVSDGCEINSVKQCDGWLLDILEDHMTYGSVAHGNSQFFPWHRAYLKALETKMQLYHPCVTLPWWDWTQDQDPMDDSQFGWTEGRTTGGDKGVWGFINGNQNEMGSFTNTGSASVPAWTLPPSFGNLARGASVSSISNLPTTTTLAGYLARASFGTSPAFKSFEGPHGGPHVMIGGQMGNFRSPADPIFWLHHAAVDKLWYDWQALHLPGTDYDANPSTLMPPFDVAPEDVFDSRNDLGVCYEPWSGITPPARRRLLSEDQLSTRRRLLSEDQLSARKRLLSEENSDTICPAVYNPVCCNGQTYLNKCQAKSCLGTKIYGKCDQCICTKEYKPVCCGGQTYSNKCIAQCNCDSRVINEGRCRYKATKATAIEYGLIASLTQLSLENNVAVALANKINMDEARQNLENAFESSQSCLKRTECGENCEFCVELGNDATGHSEFECRDVWATNMFMDPVALRENDCVDKEFMNQTSQSTNTAQISGFNLVEVPSADKISKCAAVRCPADTNCVEIDGAIKCVCKSGYVDRNGFCEILTKTDFEDNLDDNIGACLALLDNEQCLRLKNAWKTSGCAGTCSTRL